MQTQTTTGTAPASMPIDTVDPSQLPAVITEQVKRKGDLIDVTNWDQAQIEAAKKIVNGFNLSDTMSILTFAAPPQREISTFLDELLDGITVKQAGVAGEIAVELAEGIDMMALARVKEQIIHPPSNNWFMRLVRWVSGWKDAIEAFYHAQRPIRDKVDKIERKAINSMGALDSHSKKLDKLVQRSSAQVRGLAIWIAAGEMILLGAIEQYETERARVLESKDPLAASQLRDMARQIAAFEKRLLETKIAYVEASSVTIPRVRMVQEALTIEIQNISEQILFQLPKFKAAIVQVAALKDTADAQQRRQVMNANERKLDGVLDDAVQQTARIAKESQGSPLDRVKDLEKVIASIKQGVDEGIALESQTRQQREEAERILLNLKNVVTDALKQADLSNANVDLRR